MREIERRNAALLIAWRAKWEALEEDAPDPYPPVLRRVLERELAAKRLIARQFLKSRARRSAARPPVRRGPLFALPGGRGWYA